MTMRFDQSSPDQPNLEKKILKITLKDIYIKKKKSQKINARLIVFKY